MLHKEFLLVLLVQMNDLLFGFLSFLLILVFLEFLVGCFGWLLSRVRDLVFGLSFRLNVLVMYFTNGCAITLCF